MAIEENPALALLREEEQYKKLVNKLKKKVMDWPIVSINIDYYGVFMYPQRQGSLLCLIYNGLLLVIALLFGFVTM